MCRKMTNSRYYGKYESESYVNVRRNNGIKQENRIDNALKSLLWNEVSLF